MTETILVTVPRRSLGAYLRDHEAMWLQYEAAETYSQKRLILKRIREDTDEFNAETEAMRRGAH